MLKNLLEDVKNKIFRIRAVSVFFDSGTWKESRLECFRPAFFAIEKHFPRS